MKSKHKRNVVPLFYTVVPHTNPSLITLSLDKRHTYIFFRNNYKRPPREIGLKNYKMEEEKKISERKKSP